MPLDRNIAGERHRAVAETIGRIRKIEQARGVTRGSLEAMKKELIDLAAQRDLFGHDQFPQVTQETGSRLYLLQEDEDGRFALYLSCGVPNKNVRPHDHTTWAIIVGLAGEEENRVYEILEKGGDGKSGPARVKEVRRTVLHAGEGIAYMPDDVHSIHTGDGEPTRHFHLYGLSLEKLPDRVMYDMTEGNYKNMPANSNIIRLPNA